MSPKSSVDLDTTVLDRILKNLEGNVADKIAKAGFAVEGRAKIKVPVDTGALRASIYTSLSSGDRSDDAMADATARRPGVELAPLPVPRDNHTAYVGPSVEYGDEIEFGAANRAAQPYLVPAVRETEAEFRAMWKDVVTDGR